LGTLTRQVENAAGWANQNDPRLHFGLGSDASSVDMEITWPNGTVKEVCGVAVDQTVTINYDELVDNAGFEVPVAGNGLDNRQGVHAVTFPFWGFTTLCGVADAPNVYLGGVVPDGAQAAIMNCSAGGGVGQIWHDYVASDLVDGATYTVSWKEAMGGLMGTGTITRNPDFTISMYEIAPNNTVAPAGWGENIILGATSEISNTSLVTKTVEFTVDLKLGDADPENDVTGYRFLLDARGLEGDPFTNFGLVVIDSVSITRTSFTIEDFKEFAAQWLDAVCDPENSWCDGADLDKSGNVDGVDFAIFAENWLATYPCQ